MTDDRACKVQKSSAEWRAQLDATQYEVARHAATERPFIPRASGSASTPPR
jgi:peptide-methionine (R)-S-oxide reductase